MSHGGGNAHLLVGSQFESMDVKFSADICGFHNMSL